MTFSQNFKILPSVVSFVRLLIVKSAIQLLASFIKINILLILTLDICYLNSIKERNNYVDIVFETHFLS